MLGPSRSALETAAPEVIDLPEVEVAERRGPSIVWLIPAVALAIALWLGYTTLQDRGPTVTITFEDAEGLEVGKTKIKYKDVEVGVVEDIAISDDLSQIVVTAEMVKNAEPYMNEGTRFWIVRPRIGAGGVSGLGTLVSGAFVEVDPGSGEPTSAFEGLEEPPPIRSDVAGRRYELHAEKLGSVSRGSPVYYRNVQVGQVLGYDLADDRENLVIDLFVAAPHDQLVRDDSRFWNASGVDLSLGADGVSISIESLQALLTGGIAFDTPAIGHPGEAAAAGTVFPLFENFRAVGEARYTDKVPYLVYFEGSVRGLRPGAPVEFRGMRIGSVTDVRLELDATTDAARIPVTLAIEPQRIDVTGAAADPEPYVAMRTLVERGLRAQLKSGNLLTGELLVDLDLHPESPPAKLDESGVYPEIPSVPTQLEVLTASITGVLHQLATLPLPELVEDLRRTVQGIESLVASPDAQQTAAALSGSAVRLQALLGTLDQRLGPLLAQADSTLSSTGELLGQDSQIRYEVGTLLRELTGAARSIRVFADYLERHPEALIRGKAGYP
jgi:paraquat-inducible protein B